MTSDSEAESDGSVHAMKVSYDGSAFFGWQRHGDRPTVQGTLESAIAEVLGVRAAVQGSGRTDRGAHAAGQVASTVLPSIPDLSDVRRALNETLPTELRVLAFVRVPAGFHALESCIGKRYRYEMWVDEDCPAEKQGRVWHARRPLDLPAMKEAGFHLLGEKDFASFATKTNFKPKSTVRNLSELMIDSSGPGLTIVMKADGFLYKMVRNIVRSLVKVGEGKLTPTGFGELLAAKDRSAAVGSAPASGLYLDEVFYAEKIFDD